METRSGSRLPTDTAGAILAVVGAAAYGVTVVIGRRLAEDGVAPATALGCRFAIAAIVLAVLLRARGLAIAPDRAELMRLALLGAIGYTTESTFFYLSLQRGTAAACSLLIYAYPAVVCAIELARGRERPTRSTLVALALAVVGTTIVAATGSRVSITPTGVVFALSAAVVYAVYLVVGREISRRADPMRAATWVAAGAAASSFARGPISGELSDPTEHLPALIFYGSITSAAFALTFAALRRIGAARTAVIMTLEAVTAVVLGALFLGERIGRSQIAGGAAILVAAALIGRRQRIAEDVTIADLGE